MFFIVPRSLSIFPRSLTIPVVFAQVFLELRSNFPQFSSTLDFQFPSTFLDLPQSLDFKYPFIFRRSVISLAFLRSPSIFRRFSLDSLQFLSIFPGSLDFSRSPSIFPWCSLAIFWDRHLRHRYFRVSLFLATVSMTFAFVRLAIFVRAANWIIINHFFLILKNQKTACTYIVLHRLFRRIKFFVITPTARQMEQATRNATN